MKRSCRRLAVATLAVVGCAAGSAHAADFAPAVNYPGSSHPFGLALADLDGNGATDVVTADETGARATVLLGRGDGSLGGASGYAAGYPDAQTQEFGAAPNDVVAGDFDHDGRPDLAVSHNLPDDDPGGVAILRNSGTWTPVASGPGGGARRRLGAGRRHARARPRPAPDRPLRDPRPARPGARQPRPRGARPHHGRAAPPGRPALADAEALLAPRVHRALPRAAGRYVVRARFDGSAGGRHASVTLRRTLRMPRLDA